MAGRLAGVASKSSGAWQITLYSYDADGRVATQHTFSQDDTGTWVSTQFNTTIEYTRDLRDALLERRLTIGSYTFNHWYEYDDRGLLWKVYTSTTSSPPATPDVTYTYRPSGQVASRQFLGGPQVPLSYTIREQLAKIGDPAGTTYPFSARYAYHPNGTVSEAEFHSPGSPAAAKRYRYTFGGASYDALNRLKSADFSYYSGGWISTTAHDLAAIGYDAAGNLTALQRRRETGSLIDNLTYSYPGSSNRLTSVTDAVVGSAETWDAESGSFTYDANGNMKTAPAPYSVSAVTYDHQNLPLSSTRSGTTTTYRYDHAGQRISKRLGGGNTDVYVREGPLTLSVPIASAGGSVVGGHFNIVAGDQVVGRYTPSTGTKRYYHTDLLGSTRAVVENGAIVESYDFEPWGLLMPGRTLGSGTKEGFTGKERDAETGLDYFGARYYMPALGRWSSVDPLADQFAGWSAYNYVLNNPVGMVDPDGRCPEFITGRPCSLGFSIAVGFVPVVGDAIDIIGAGIGRDLLTGEAITGVGVAATVVGTLLGSGKLAREGAEVVEQAVKKGDAPGGALPIPDDAVVCRGGSCTADRFTRGSGVTTDDTGRLHGVSVNVGESLETASRGIPHSRVGVTTAGEVRAAGGSVVSDPSVGNPMHSIMSGITPQKAEELFTPTVPNPNR